MTVELESVTIRTATRQDASRIAQVHVSSWQSAYADLLPTDYLAELDPAARTVRWEAVLTDAEESAAGSQVLVAEQGEHTLGFASFGPSPDEDADPDTYQLYAMYLELSAWGRGVARELMRTVLGAVPTGSAMTLWVLKGNTRAQHFYHRHGFRPDGVERIEEFGDVPLTEVRYLRAAS